jgi:hypothetical protein
MPSDNPDNDLDKPPPPPRQRRNETDDEFTARLASYGIERLRKILQDALTWVRSEVESGAAPEARREAAMLEAHLLLLQEAPADPQARYRWVDAMINAVEESCVELLANPKRRRGRSGAP